VQGFFLGCLEMKKILVTFFREGDLWVASCDEVGLVGYQHKNLNEVKDLVKEGMLLYADVRTFELIETVEPPGNRTAA
jgi:hypothetical protein